MSLCKLSAPDGLTGFPAAEHKSHFGFGDGFPRGTGGRSIELVKNIAWPVLVLFLNSSHLLGTQGSTIIFIIHFN